MLLDRKRLERDAKSSNASAILWVFTVAGFFVMFLPLTKLASGDVQNALIGMAVMIPFGSIFAIFFGLRLLIKIKKAYRTVKKGKFYILIDEISSLRYDNRGNPNHHKIYVSLKRRQEKELRMEPSSVPTGTRRGEQVILIMLEGEEESEYQYIGNRYILGEDLMKYVRYDAY